MITYWKVVFSVFIALLGLEGEVWLQEDIHIGLEIKQISGMSRVQMGKAWTPGF